MNVYEKGLLDILRHYICLLKLPFLFLFFTPCILLGDSLENNVQAANAYYQDGQKASTFKQREDAFNQALMLYDSIEKELGHPVSEVNEAIANSYFQLEAYPWAILYYHRALKSKPKDQVIIQHLKLAYQKLGLTPSSLGPLPFQGLMVAIYRSSSKLFGLIYWLAILVFLVYSLSIWLPYPSIRKTAILSLILSMIFFSVVFVSRYMVPLESIIVKSTGLYREPDFQAHLSNEPLLAGSEVYVFQSVAHGNWLKIVDSKGKVGYIPAAAVRII